MSLSTRQKKVILMASTSGGYCRFCRKVMNTIMISGKECCGGCGSYKANAILTKPTPAQSKPKPKCPQCGDHRCDEPEPGRKVCTSCGANFEADDFGFVDSRPFENACKREEHAGRGRGRRVG